MGTQSRGRRQLRGGLQQLLDLRIAVQVRRGALGLIGQHPHGGDLRARIGGATITGKAAHEAQAPRPRLRLAGGALLRPLEGQRIGDIGSALLLHETDETQQPLARLAQLDDLLLCQVARVEHREIAAGEHTVPEAVALVLTGRHYKRILAHLTANPEASLLRGLAHELGHFLAAKACGVRVLKFSLGFGPPIGIGSFRLAWKRGHTEYVVAWIPLGGFVKMLGEHPDEQQPDRGVLPEPAPRADDGDATDHDGRAERRDKWGGQDRSRRGERARDFIQARRRRGNGRTTGTERADDEEAAQRAPAPSSTPAEHTEMVHVQEAVRVAIGQIPEPYRSALVLRELPRLLPREGRAEVGVLTARVGTRPIYETLTAQQIRERIDDVIENTPELAEIQAALVADFCEHLGLAPAPGTISAAERREAEILHREEIGTEEFVTGIEEPPRARGDLAGERVCPGGTIRSYLRLEGPAQNRIRGALITGDFFVTPPRVIFDLESRLRGVYLEDLDSVITDFFEEAGVDVLSVAPGDFVASIRDALDRA